MDIKVKNGNYIFIYFIGFFPGRLEHRGPYGTQLLRY